MPDLRQLHFCVEIGSLSIDAGFSAGARAVAATKCSRGFGSDAAVPGISVAAGFTNTASRSLRSVRQLRHCFCFCSLDRFPRSFKLYDTLHAPRAVAYLVPVLIVCGLVLAIRRCAQFGASGAANLTIAIVVGNASRGLNAQRVAGLAVRDPMFIGNGFGSWFGDALGGCSSAAIVNSSFDGGLSDGAHDSIQRGCHPGPGRLSQQPRSRPTRGEHHPSSDV